jgi:hypothetical protein
VAIKDKPLHFDTQSVPADGTQAATVLQIRWKETAASLMLPLQRSDEQTNSDER